MADILAKEISKISNILDAVPMKPGIVPKCYFLGIYHLTFQDIKSLELTETQWEQLHPVPVNKLLKLGISFGNLVKSFLIEQASYESKQAQELNVRKNARQSVDPFLDNYKLSKLPVATHYVNFATNFLLLLKNFDIGTTQQLEVKRSRNSRASLGIGDSDIHSNSGSHTTLNSGMTGLPIKLNSRQLLIEKLEINLNLDPLFTMKIVLKLLVSMFTIVRALVGTTEEVSELSAIKAYSENSSIFSTNSSASGGNVDPIQSMEDYLRLINDIVLRVNLGIVDPFNSMILVEIVEPRVLESFQGLTNSI